MMIALGIFALSAVIANFHKPMNVNDWGVFAIEVGTPALILISQRRTELLVATGYFCVVFGLVDAVVNILAWADVLHIASYAEKRDVDEVSIHYPGLSENTHAVGLVAMTGLFALASSIKRSGMPKLILTTGAILALFVSLYLSDARRYIWMAVVGFTVIAVPISRILPLVVLACAIALFALYGTFFNVFDPLDDLRARLMADGFFKALHYPIFGGGVYYRDMSNEVPGYSSLSNNGITESGFLDFCIAYGIPAATLFTLSALVALAARRRVQSMPAVLLAMLTATLAFGNILNGFLGAILFYGSLIWVQQDEGRRPSSMRPVPREALIYAV